MSTEIEGRMEIAAEGMKSLFKLTSIPSVAVFVAVLDNDEVAFKTTAQGIPPLMIAQIAYEMLYAAVGRIGVLEDEKDRQTLTNMQVAMNALCEGMSHDARALQ